jgi:hypothetical protein
VYAFDGKTAEKRLRSAARIALYRHRRPAGEARKQTEHQPLASRPDTSITSRPDTIITTRLFALGPHAQVEIASPAALDRSIA